MNTATSNSAEMTFGSRAYYEMRALEKCAHMARITKRGETLYTAYRALARGGLGDGLTGGAIVRITDKGTALLASRHGDS